MGADALAYFITFRSYGTWLHGDARGSVDREHNIPGTPWLPPDPQRERRERKACEQPATVLDGRQRQVVQQTIIAVCDHNDWSIHELEVRSNHVHVVVSAAQRPEHVMRSLKSWCTRRLRESGLLSAKAEAWARHGSTRYLWKPEQLAAACRYVRDGQGGDL